MIFTFNQSCLDPTPTIHSLDDKLTWAKQYEHTTVKGEFRLQLTNKFQP